MPDMLITAAENLRGVRVDSIRPHTGLLEAHRELELVDHIAAAPGKPAKLQVSRTKPLACCGSAGAPSCGSTESGIDRMVGSPGAPETHINTVPWLPTPRSRSMARMVGCHRCGAT